jgi:hypothetical protein
MFTYRSGIQPSILDGATLILSAGMLAFTTVYLLTKPEQAKAAPGEASIPELARALDWRVLFPVLRAAGRLPPTTDARTTAPSASAQQRLLEPFWRRRSLYY